MGGTTVKVAHADMRKGPDTRWPIGSAMNPIQPGASESSHAMQRYARKKMNALDDNNDL